MKKYLGMVSAVPFLVLLAACHTGGTSSSMPATQDFNYTANTDTSPRTVFTPHFSDADLGTRFREMGLFWFGAVYKEHNYTDVRTAYNDTGVYFNITTFDRRLWWDDQQTPDKSTFVNWDSVELLLDTGSGATGLSDSSFRFAGMLSQAQTADSNYYLEKNYRAAYRPAGHVWAMDDGFAFNENWAQTGPGWRGEWFNNDQDDKGWAYTFFIPFSSLGKTPATGDQWRLAVKVHDRDDAAGTAIIDKGWPNDSFDVLSPASWGYLTFGIPAFHSEATTGTSSILLRDKLNQTIAWDRSCGGGSTAGGDVDYWTEWGLLNSGTAGSFNVQNQSDVSDYPNFSKCFMTFGLDAIPRGKKIVSATLKLYQMGNSTLINNGTDSMATKAFLQIFKVNEDWNKDTICWNRAPYANGNYGGAYVDKVPTVGGLQFGHWRLPSSLTATQYDTMLAMVTNADDKAFVSSNYSGYQLVNGISEVDKTKLTSILRKWSYLPPERTFDISMLMNEAYLAGNPLRMAIYSAESEYHSGIYFVSSGTEDWNETNRPSIEVIYAD